MRTEDPLPQIAPLDNDWQIISWGGKSSLFHLKSFLFLEHDLTIQQSLQKKNNLLSDLKIFSQNPNQQNKLHHKTIVIALNLIQKCNLSCHYCFAEKGHYGKDSIMSFETAIKAINLFKNNANKMHISFFGGEPLLNYILIKKIVSWAKKQEKNISFSITTNGSLLNLEKINYFKKNHINLRISYDGKKIQEKQRPNSNALFERKVSTILEKYKDLLQKTQGYIRSTYPLNDLNEIKQSILEITNFFDQGFSFLPPSRTQFKTSPEDLIEKLEKFLMNYLKYWVAKKNPDKALKLINISTLVTKIKQQRTQENYCSAGLNYFTVSASGDFFICHRFNENKQMQVGSINEGLQIDVKEKIEAYRSAKQEPCKSCWIRYICQGGCLHEHNLKITKNSFFCLIQKMEVRLALYYIKITS